ncbi:uncharacterized protein N7482_006572 [Penicillium canariense]|uniref:Uncharacterized protein n=1 Tax=Penicillium canariense TaxID=189055 RepID=A0A9W9HXE5_9EURO|nr:uncharacterized protein N7482_006572 [Penicillium canariense]KAJ5159568.1 hypothetical protein N7482_006572 [Penicillium canariense]
MLAGHFAHCDCEQCSPLATTLLLLEIDEQPVDCDEIRRLREEQEARVYDKLRKCRFDHETQGVLEAIQARFKGRASFFTPTEIEIVWYAWEFTANSSLHPAPESWLSLILIAVFTPLLLGNPGRDAFVFMPSISSEDDITASVSLKQTVSFMVGVQARARLLAVTHSSPGGIFEMKWSQSSICGQYLLQRQIPYPPNHHQRKKAWNEWAMFWLRG